MHWIVLAISVLFSLPAHAQTVIFYDECTDTEDTPLENHTPNIGTSWVLIGANGVQHLIKSNTCRSGAAGGSSWTRHYADATYPHGNYTVAIRYSVLPDTDNPGRGGWIGCRYADISGISGYFASVAQADTTNDVRLYRFTAGTGTKLSGSEDVNPTSGDVFELVCEGNQVGLKRNGSYVLGPYTDNTYSTGAAFVGWGDLGSVTDMTSPGITQAFDRFTVTLSNAGRNRGGVILP